MGKIMNSEAAPFLGILGAGIGFFALNRLTEMFELNRNTVTAVLTGLLFAVPVIATAVKRRRVNGNMIGEMERDGYIPRQSNNVDMMEEIIDGGYTPARDYELNEKGEWMR